MARDAMDTHGALGQRAFRPGRPRLLEALGALTGAPAALCEAVLREGPEDALAVVTARAFARVGSAYTGHLDPREAWEAVAPEDWAEDPQRAFQGTPEAPGRPWPWSLRAALVFASDPPGMLAAEALAQDLVLRLGVAGAELPLPGLPLKVTWTLVSGRGWRARHNTPPARDALEALAAGAGEALSEAQRRGAELAAEKVRDALARRLGAAAWDAAAAVRWELLGRGLGAEQPFSPLCALWETGYALDALTADGVVLAAPPC